MGKIKSNKLDWELFPSEIDWMNTFVRTNKFPLDRSSIFKSYEDAKLYAENKEDSRGLGGTSYIGQIISVLNDGGSVKVYKINNDRTLEELTGITDINLEKIARITQDNKIEEAIGLSEEGSHIDSDGTYTKGAKTITEEIKLLDTILLNTNNDINKMNLTEIGDNSDASSKYIKYIKLDKGKVIASSETFDSSLNTTSVSAPQTKVVDAAVKAAKTIVNAKNEINDRIKITVTTATDGHNIVTISENDIAQKTLLDAEIIRSKKAEEVNATTISNEIKNRKIITGINGDICSFNNTNYLDNLDSLYDATTILDSQIKKNSDIIASEKERINVLLGTEEKDLVINNFKDIENFLKGITDSLTLTGLLKSLEEIITAKIPTKTSDLINDDYVVKDAAYVHTDTNFTLDEKTKLTGIETGALVNIVNSVSGKIGDIKLTKDDVGLDKVDNTFDVDKPISKATQAALNTKLPNLVSGVNIATINGESLLLGKDIIITSGDNGTNNYNLLENKPSINDVVLTGNKTLDDLNIQVKGEYALKTDIPIIDVNKTYVDTKLGNKVDKVDGKSLILDTEITRLSKVDNYILTKSKVENVLTGNITTHSHADYITLIELEGKNFATKDELTEIFIRRW